MVKDIESRYFLFGFLGLHFLVGLCVLFIYTGGTQGRK